MKKAPDTHPPPDFQTTNMRSQKRTKKGTLPALAWYALGLLLCTLLLATPLARLDGSTLQYKLPTSFLVLLPGGWMPIRLSFFGQGSSAELTTHLLFFILFLTFAFAIYGTAAYGLWRRKILAPLQTHLRWILLTTCVCGIVFVLTPALLSHDAFAYASYGRLLAIYHVNPYFVPLTHFPQDPLYVLDDWRETPSAYGPLCTAISALLAWICGEQPINALRAYQFLGLMLHLLNTSLTFLTLRRLKQPSRIVALGTLLYAWNPLLLIESCLSGHNDTLLITFLLLALSSTAHLEAFLQKTRSFQFRLYFFPLTMISLAVLIKFTAAPMLILFLVLLARHSFQTSSSTSRIRITLLRLVLASLFSGTLMLLLYIPFWIGWSLSDIIKSFTSTPAATQAYGSVLRALQEWVKAYGPPTTGFNALFFSIFLQRRIWNDISTIVFSCTLLLALIWTWRSPTTPTLALATLISLGTLLLVTPWFFPWYVTWLLPLAVVGLAAKKTRIQKAFIGSTLVFSASCCCIYFFKNGLYALGGWVGFVCLTTVLPPILAFFIIFSFTRPKQEEKL